MQADKPAVECICCGNFSATDYFIKKNESGCYPVVKCSSCGSAFVWPRPDIRTISSHYSHESYSNLSFEESVRSDLRYYPDSSGDSTRILRMCRKMAAGKRLLDAGAGYGMFSRAALDMGFEVSACEPNSNARKVFLQLNGFAPDPDMFDRQYASRHRNSFDVVLLSQVLEHVVHPEEAVKNITMVLRPGGIASIAVPHFGSALSRIQGQNDMFISPPEHLNFFSRKGLTALFGRNGFRLEQIETVSKVNRGKIRDAVRFPLLRDGVWIGLYGLLKVFEAFGMGMVINAYFRKGG